MSEEAKESQDQAKVQIATAAGVLILGMQIIGRFELPCDPLVPAAILAGILAFKVAILWRKPVDWVIATILILGASNGGTNMAANWIDGTVDQEAASISFVQQAYADTNTTENTDVPDKPKKPPPKRKPIVKRW